jgi:D-alanyl-D-alanine dipeptidase
MQGAHKKLWPWLLLALAPILMPVNANAEPPLVDIQSVDPTIVVQLRYAGTNNVFKHPLYPQGTRALARSEVAAALTKAQTLLRRYQYGLKIWDAYRPVTAQTKLWQALRNSDYVANPEVGAGSLHSWGIAVDATLVDSWNRPVSMPSDFDAFTPAATWRYTGPSFEILGHVRLLQWAMHKAGFSGMSTEWWHFTIADWKKFLPEEARESAHVQGSQWNGKL